MWLHNADWSTLTRAHQNICSSMLSRSGTTRAHTHTHTHTHTQAHTTLTIIWPAKNKCLTLACVNTPTPRRPLISNQIWASAPCGQWRTSLIWRYRWSFNYLYKLRVCFCGDFMLIKNIHISPSLTLYFVTIEDKSQWRCRGLNPGPHTCEACALPLSYIPIGQK